MRVHLINLKIVLSTLSTVALPKRQYGYRTLFGIAVSCIFASSAAATTQLRLLSWDSYIDPAVVAEFEHEFDAQLILEVFDSGDQRDIHLAERNGRGYDLIVVDGTQLQPYAKRGWLAPVDELDIENRNHVDDRWKTAFPAAERYGTAYFWGVLGIAWRQDLWPEEFTSWHQLLNPSSALNGRLLMTSYARELVGVTLKAAGFSANFDNPATIDAAGKLLAEQGPGVRYYGYPDLDETSPLITGEVVAAMTYNGDALVLQNIDPDIRFKVPDEGGLLWIDYITLSSFATQPELAARFINFLNRPDIAARQAEYVQYASPNNAAKALLPAEFLNNRDIYPTADVMKVSEFLYPISSQSQRRVNAIGAYLMAQ